MRKVAILLMLLGVVAARPAAAQDTSFGASVVSDFHFLANNTEADAEDFLTAPLHAGELFNQSPHFYLTAIGAGVALGGAFALDQTIRPRVRKIGSRTGLQIQNAAELFNVGADGMLYLWGMYEGDRRAREYAITGGESAALASLVTIAFKYGFGRLRPRQGQGHTRFFDHGQSFVSGDSTPGFALAAAISEYAGNDWRVAVPAYSGAMAVGVARMARDAHWFSDVVGSAIVGVGMTELLLHLHQEHAQNPSRFRIFPVVAPAAVGRGGTRSDTAYGAGLGFDW